MGLAFFFNSPCWFFLFSDSLFFFFPFRARQVQGFPPHQEPGFFFWSGVIVYFTVYWLSLWGQAGLSSRLVGGTFFFHFWGGYFWFGGLVLVVQVGLAHFPTWKEVFCWFFFSGTIGLVVSPVRGPLVFFWHSIPRFSVWKTPQFFFFFFAHLFPFRGLFILDPSCLPFRLEKHCFFFFLFLEYFSLFFRARPSLPFVAWSAFFLPFQA